MKERYILRFVEKIKSKELAEKIANWKYPSPYDIYNLDETGATTVQRPPNVIAPKGTNRWAK